MELFSVRVPRYPSLRKKKKNCDHTGCPTTSQFQHHRGNVRIIVPLKPVRVTNAVVEKQQLLHILRARTYP